MSDAAAHTLHVAYGDALAATIQETLPAADLLVVREALRDGPLVPSPNEDPAAFIAMRAHHLAVRHGADESEARIELADAWNRIATFAGDVVLHVDADPCIECATFTACALETLHRAGRGIAHNRTGVAIARGSTDPIALASADIAAGAGAWRLLVEGDAAGLTLAATDLEGQGGMAGFPELPGLLVHRAEGDVPLADVHK